MVKDQQIQTIATSSALSRFALEFEYNKTLREVRRDVRVRTVR